MEPNERLKNILDTVFREGILKKAILSRPQNQAILRAEARLFTKKDKILLQIETFTADGKALHRNISLDSAAEILAASLGDYRQLNLITTGGNIEARISSKGKLLLSGKLRSAAPTAPTSHNREKQTILRRGVPYDFLVKLGVTDGNGAVIDRKQAKYHQIERFLQYISDIYPRLPADGTLYVLDLCCGKSYLTFAAYWYLTAVRMREVVMVGADRKADVIAYCAATAEELGYRGLSFRCCDILTFVPERTPDLVLSLHACDIATDIVLTTAARLGARVILSTPCCQHEINDQLSLASPLGSQLAPILEHSLLKQKLAVALTDALRCKRLEAAGYRVDVTELIDPENTPKNLMIRAIRSSVSEREKEKHREEFRRLSLYAGVTLFGGDGSDALSDYDPITCKEDNNA